MASCLLVSQLTKGVTLARFNRPERLHALSEEMAGSIIELCRNVNADKSCVGVVFTGDTRAFSTGRDLKLSASHSESDVRRYMDLACESVLAVAELEVPSCAAVDGHCLGWGFELALACDFRAVSKSTRMRLPETSLGLFPGAGGAVLLPRVVGQSIANDLIYTAREISGREAYDLGLASRISNEGETALDAATVVMKAISQNAPLALRAGKKAMKAADSISNVREALAATRAFRDPLSASADHKEALLAFKERRKPVFKGE